MASCVADRWRRIFVMNRNQHEADALIVPGVQMPGFQKSPEIARICVGSARAMYVGPGLDLSPHLNVATTIAVSLDGPFELRMWAKTGGWLAWRPALVSLIPSESLHHLKCFGPMVFLYLDPLADRQPPKSHLELMRSRERLLKTGRRMELQEAFSAFDLRNQAPRDARVTRVVRAIESDPGAFNRLQDAAAVACLSPSRFRARFTAELGLPFRRFRLWRRMAAVMHALADEENLTAAAHLSGFASSAHLSSAFKKMFGLSPGVLLSMRVVIDVTEDKVLSVSDT
jgi:AraC-like DNA-binding protein